LSKDATNSGKSPLNMQLHTPAHFDFLEDDIFNEESHKRGKSKTEFLKREPYSQGGTQVEQEVEDVEAYINCIVPNNSIKFAKPN